MPQVIAIAFKTKKQGAMLEVQSALVTKESGVAQDIYGKPGKRQVTLMSRQQWQAACDQVKHELPWTVRRANIMVDGIKFNASYVGKQLIIGDLILEVTGETAPCKKMEMACPGLEAALAVEWRGGVTCRVIEPGQITVMDDVTAA
ncbi:MAG: MOSC domain-containing protein [Shewanella sp.]|nr:MOSC domain-containing protein [Shewanella sp.]MCF1431064.1 MOSC domain-containing protein [Shewanella sp.]MCF1439763.1 MOSC domain-containing protein [Shewanella sp.]MCF1457339.1 MOSC domain-containing protein [Shewanella sp.]